MLAELHSRGVHPELVVGVESDPIELGRIVDAQRERTFYVFCESENFSARDIRRAQGVLGARKGPGDSMHTVHLESAADAIALELMHFRGREDNAAPPVSHRKLMRDVVRLPSGAAVRPADSGAPELEGAQPSWRAPKAEREPGTRIPGRSVDLPSMHDEGEDAEDDRGVLIPASDDDADEDFDIPTDDDDELPPEPAPEPEPEDEAAGIPEPIARAHSQPPSPSPAPERRGHIGAIILLLVLAAAAGTAWIILNGEDAAQPQSRGLRGAPTVEGESAAEATASEAEADEAGDEAAAASGRVGDAPGDPAPQGSSQAVIDAIATGELSVLNLLYIAPPARENRDHASAEAHCAELELAGLRGFRLASVEELKQVRHANMLERGAFWTSQVLDEEFAYVIDTERGADPVRVRRRLAGGQPFCVRGI